MEFRSGQMFSLILATCVVLLAGCSEPVRQHIRAHDFRTFQAAEANLNANRAASPIADVPEMPDWSTDFESAVAFTRVNPGSTLVFFYEKGDPASERMQRILNDPAVRQASQGMQRIAVDVSRRPQLAATYRLSGVPTVAVLNAAGGMQAGSTGQISRAEVLALLAR